MNSSVYLFGSLSSGYTQYPDDNKKSLFKSLADRIYTRDMIVVRRDGNLLYYVYARSISSGQTNSHYIGFSIELNGLYYNDVSSLFTLFEDAFTKVVLSGKFVEFNEDGDIVAKASQIHHEQGEVNRVVQSLLAHVENLPEANFKKLPPLNYSAGLNEGIHLSNTSSSAEVDNALIQYNAINIYKNSSDGGDALAGYADKIKSLSGKIKDLSKENASLSDDLVKTKRQKKRTTIVTVLSLLIATAVVVIISVGSNLSEQVRNLKHNISVLQDELKEKEEVIDARDKIIKKNASEIKTLKASISDIQKKLSASKSENDSLSSQVNDLKGQVSALTSRNKSLESQAGVTKVQPSSRSSSNSSGGNSSSSAKMSISAESLTIDVGASKTLYAYNYGSSIQWESDNRIVATVTSSGVVKGVSAGTTTIWAKGKEYKRCVVTVVSKYSSGGTASPGDVYLSVRQTIQLTNGSKKASKWESDNTKVATVTSTGLVKAVGKGKTNVWGYFDGSPKRYYIQVY